MKERVLIKNKSFFRKSIIVLFCMLLLAFFIVGSVYRISINTLQKEIQEMSASKTKEISNRVEDVIKRCNEFAITISLKNEVQMYFVCPDPQYYFDDFDKNMKACLDSLAIPYIDSVILYAPEYNRMYDKSDGNRTVSLEGQKNGATGDTSWFDMYQQNQDADNLVFAQAKTGEQLYYLTVMNRWNKSGTEGIVLVNINLEKLYHYLLMENDSSTQLYLIDSENKVSTNTGRREGSVFMDEEEVLKAFQEDITFGEIHIIDNEVYTYEKCHLEKYELTCATITPVGDYFVRLSQLQQRLIWMICFAAIIVLVVTCVYSLHIVKPKQENIMLREELNQSVDLLKDSRLVALQTQINPHFMFNTLNTASLMIESDCGDGHPAASLLGGLSDILRYSLSKNSVCIREELACIEKYLSIMQYRYGDFEVLIDADEEIYDYAIPKLILQPLIENALQHGISLCMDARTGRIEIRVKEVMYAYANGKEQRSICFDISDNGMGIDEEKLEKLKTTIQNHKIIPEEHIGLYNVAQRLYLLYHEEQEVTIDSTFSKGTHIRLIFPITIRK